MSEHEYVSNAVRALGDRHSEPKTDNLGLPEGMVEYGVRASIRDLMRVYGFESGRQIVAEIVNDEASGRRRS